MSCLHNLRRYTHPMRVPSRKLDRHLPGFQVRTHVLCGDPKPLNTFHRCGPNPCSYRISSQANTAECKKRTNRCMSETLLLRAPNEDEMVLNSTCLISKGADGLSAGWCMR